MRTACLLITTILIDVCLFAAPYWMESSPPAAPSVHLVEATNQQIVFDVDIPGFWASPIDSGTLIYAGGIPNPPALDPAQRIRGRAVRLALGPGRTVER